MKKEILTIPRGIRYISDFEKYSLRNYPFPHILNKQITGCGFTEYCITNDMDIILCSPRKILLENKQDQHSNDVFYFKNEFDKSDLDFDKDLSSLIKKSASEENEKDSINSEEDLVAQSEMYEKIYRLKRDLLSYIEKRKSQGLPSKILVTYDSFKLVREFIEKDLRVSMNGFQVVIDEFQSIFIDSRFKSTTEINFLSNLSGINKVCFVSATPMLDPYLEMLDEFKNLPYFEFDWKTEDPSRVVKPTLLVHSCKSLYTAAKNIVDSYLTNNFDLFSYRDPLGRICEIKSTEAVLYFNSVKNICDVIRKCGLTPDNTNVLCSKTPKNLKKIKKAFKDACGRKDGDIGSVPKRGEKHKMFTFCTRTVYLGADFYSTCARSFIFSDANIDCLAVDISLDLPQILGRQRLSINPWKNSAELYFKNLAESKNTSREQFDKVLSEKTEETDTLLRLCSENKSDPTAFRALIDRFEFVAKAKNYEKDYFSVNYDEKGEPYPVFNKLVKIAEMRAFDIQQVDYKDRFSTFSTLDTSGINLELGMVEELLQTFNSMPLFSQRMKFVCEVSKILNENDFGYFLCQIPMIYGNYFNILGSDRCGSMKYQQSDIKREYDRVVSNQDIDLKQTIYSNFKIGDRLTSFDIKQQLTNLYDSVGYNKVAKATDLKEFFELRTTQITKIDPDSGKKKVFNGFEILSIKGEE